MAAIDSVTAIYPVQRKMIDIHTHVIYGVDDGSRSAEMSMEMLRASAEAGVTEICCTTHCRPGHREFPRQAYDGRLGELRGFILREGLELTLHAGCEIMYTSGTAAALRGGLLPTLGGSGNVLVEFMPETPWGMIQHALREIGNAGFGVVAAHVERYACLRQEFSWLEEMKEMGALLQMNAEAVLRSHGFFGDRWARRALKTGLIDVVASDMHNVSSRRQNMKEAREILKKDFGESRAAELTEENPRRILTGSAQPERRAPR